MIKNSPYGFKPDCRFSSDLSSDRYSTYEYNPTYDYDLDGSLFFGDPVSVQYAVQGSDGFASNSDLIGTCGPITSHFIENGRIGGGKFIIPAPESGDSVGTPFIGFFMGCSYTSSNDSSDGGYTQVVYANSFVAGTKIAPGTVVTCFVCDDKDSLYRCVINSSSVRSVSGNNISSCFRPASFWFPPMAERLLKTDGVSSVSMVTVGSFVLPPLLVVNKVDDSDEFLVKINHSQLNIGVSGIV